MLFGPPLAILGPPLCWLELDVSTRGRRVAEMGEIWVELSSWWEESKVVFVWFDPEWLPESFELLWLETLRRPGPAGCLPALTAVSIGVNLPDIELL